MPLVMISKLNIDYHIYRIYTVITANDLWLDETKLVMYTGNQMKPTNQNIPSLQLITVMGVLCFWDMFCCFWTRRMSESTGYHEQRAAFGHFLK